MNYSGKNGSDWVKVTGWIYNWDLSYDPSWTPLRDLLYLICGFGVTVVTILGIIMNILSVIVFLQPKLRQSSISILLVGLQVSDIIILTSLLWTRGLSIIFLWCGYEYYDKRGSILSLVVWSVYYFGCLGSRYVIIVVSLERYIAVCHPLKVTVFCSPRRAIVVLILVATFAFACGLVKWFSSGIKEHIGRSAFVWISISIIQFVPFVALLVLNIAIYIGFRRSQKVLRSVRSTCGQTESNSPTSILLSIVLVYLLSNSFEVIYNLTKISDFVVGQPRLFVFYVIKPLVHFLLAVNSSCNFIFYCAFGTKFRSELWKVLRCDKGVLARSEKRKLESRQSASSQLSNLSEDTGM